MTIINQTHEGTFYSIEALGAAVDFIDWPENCVTINPDYYAALPKFPETAALERITARNRKIKKLKNVGLFGDA